MAPDVSLPEFYRYLCGVKTKATAKKYTEYAGKFLKLMRDSGFNRFEDIPRGLLAEFTSVQVTTSGRSASTIRVQTYAAKKYLEWVASKGISVALQNKPELPKKELRQRPTLSPDLFSLYFRHADMDLSEPTRTAVMLLPCCGLRASEVIGLKLSQIRKADIQIKGKKKTTLFLQVVGKGNKERSVPLMEEGVEILTGYLAGWRRRQGGPWLFPKVTSKRNTSVKSGERHISDRLLRNALQKMREPLGMEFTPHTMRRTYITMLWRKGLDLGAIAKIAGHANVQTTLDHYIVMDPTDSVQALHNAGSSLTE